MGIFDSRNFHPACLGAVAAIASTPVAIYLSTRGIAEQGQTATYETTEGQIVAQGGGFGYTYRVEGTDYTGTRESFLRGGESLTAGAGVAAGETVRVYYDPMNPKRAVLTPGTPLSAFATAGLCGVGLPMVAAGFWFLSRWDIERRRRLAVAPSRGDTTAFEYREAA